MSRLNLFSSWIGLLLTSAAGTSAFAQTPGTFAHIFAFGEETAEVLLDEMTFTEQRKLDVEACTITAQLNGPIACASSCNGTPICLLALVGPPGLTVDQVLTKESEEPIPAASLLPSAVSDPSLLGTLQARVRAAG